MINVKYWQNFSFCKFKKIHSYKQILGNVTVTIAKLQCNLKNKILHLVFIWLILLKSYLKCFIWTLQISPKKSRWKRISSKHNAIWQHLSQLKASAFFSLQKIVVKKCNNLYLGLVMPSNGWQSPIVKRPI
jgi:hypothetical protein